MFLLDPSDVALIIDLALAVFLALYFAAGRPRTWYRDRLGWAIFGYAVATVALLSLIVFGTVFGQRVIEPVRFVVGAALGVALASKTWSVYRERREGRLAGSRAATDERNLMSIPTPRGDASKAALAKATEIWYKAQRVLRTGFTTLLTVLPLVPQVIAIIQGQWDAVWLGPIAVQAVAINSALTGIIALPKVNAWLTKVGLGSVPKSAIVRGVVTPSGEVGAHVAPDPKATRG